LVSVETLRGLPRCAALDLLGHIAEEMRRPIGADVYDHVDRATDTNRRWSRMAFGARCGLDAEEQVQVALGQPKSPRTVPKLPRPKAVSTSCRSN
jgi:hypothetical protein